jgi:single-stranded DNA-binding protein
MKKNINTTSNNLIIAGHLAADAQVSENKNVAHFTVLRNQERDGDPVSVRLTLFAQNGGKKAYFPVKKLVKGAHVRVAAFMRNNDFTNEETGEVNYQNCAIVKDLEFLKAGSTKKDGVNNDFTLTGFLASDVQVSENGKGGRFTVIRGQGEGNKPVAVRFTIFSAKGDKETPIPVDKLKKGAFVRVSSYMRPNNYTNDNGEKIYGISYVVKNVEFLTKEQAEQAEEAPAEAPKAPAKKEAKKPAASKKAAKAE